MTLEEIKAEILGSHEPNSQRAMLASMALTSILSGMEELQKLGHGLAFELVDKPAPQEYPKMLYRGDSSMEVSSGYEQEEAVKDGWNVHPSLQTDHPLAVVEGPSVYSTSAPIVTLTDKEPL